MLAAYRAEPAVGEHAAVADVTGADCIDKSLPCGPVQLVLLPVNPWVYPCRAV